jgi:hypothetical protein
MCSSVSDHGINTFVESNLNRATGWKRRTDEHGQLHFISKEMCAVSEIVGSEYLD